MPRAYAVAEGVNRALRPGGRFVAEFGGACCVQTVRSALGHELAERGMTALSAPGDARADLVSAVERRCRGTLFRNGAWWLDYTRLRVVATSPQRQCDSDCRRKSWRGAH